MAPSKKYLFMMRCLGRAVRKAVKKHFHMPPALVE